MYLWCCSGCSCLMWPLFWASCSVPCSVRRRTAPARLQCVRPQRSFKERKVSWILILFIFDSWIFCVSFLKPIFTSSLCSCSWWTVSFACSCRRSLQFCTEERKILFRKNLFSFACVIYYYFFETHFGLSRYVIAWRGCRFSVVNILQARRERSL